MNEIVRFIEAAGSQGAQAIVNSNKGSLADHYSIVEPIYKEATAARKIINEGLKALLDVGEIIGEWKLIDKNPYSGGTHSEKLARKLGPRKYFRKEEVFDHKLFREDMKRAKNKKGLKAIDKDKKPQLQIERTGDKGLEQAATELVERLLELASA